MYRIVVYGYPPGAGREERMTRGAEDLRTTLDGRYAIDCPIVPVRGSKEFPAFSALLMEFLDACRVGQGYVDLLWVHNLTRIANNPTPQFVDAVRQMSVDVPSLEFDFAVLEPWAARLVARPEEWQFPDSAQVLTIDGLWKTGQGGPWGSELSTYPSCSALVRNEARESMFHALLHLFGVDEGYELTDHATKTSCSTSCWMQWVPTSGDGLCDSHQAELREFLDSIRST